MALLKKDTIKLSTPMGEREVQLWIGDITMLPIEDQVDMVFTSAFYGDYSPVPGTLIGSLKRNLELSVRDLAKNKEADMRKMFSCWISEPLPAGLPYKRLVCFEFHCFKQLEGSTPMTDILSSQLSEMFRAMMPIFNNHESTVITPLLTTGNQRQSVSQVLRAMVDSACHWIKAGLPLKCLKLVLYSPNPSKLDEQNELCMKFFKRLKSAWKRHEEENAVVSQSYDVCLSYTPKDQELANKVVDELKKQNKHLAIHSEIFTVNHEQTWQGEIYEVMKNSKRIVVILTPDYVDDPDCVVQFNLALCCNRLKKEEVLMPFLFEMVPNLPNYMSLVQYTMCKARKEHETAEGLLEAACRNLIQVLASLPPTQSALKEDNSRGALDKSIAESAQSDSGKSYDILISYSHRFRDEPLKFYNILREKYPHLNIFFDQNELKAGNLWQQALFEAVDKTSCIVAFLSEGYCKSSVCQDEFSIGLARHFAQESMLLIPVHTERVEMLPRSLTSIPCVDLGQTQENLASLADKLAEMLEANSRNKHQPPFPRIFKDKMAEFRSREFKTRFRMDRGQVESKVPPAADANVEGDVAFVYAQDCLKLAAILSVLLRQHAPGLICQMVSDSTCQRRELLESARMVVVIVSDQLVGTQPLLEELHTVLCRQRSTADDTVVYLMQSGHTEVSPFYLHALPYRVSLDDENLWRRLERAASNKNPRYAVDLKGMQGTYRCTAAQNLTLSAAAHDIISLIAQGRGTGSSMPYNVTNIAEVEDKIAGVDNSLVHVHEHIITLSSINHLSWKGGQAPPRTNPASHDAPPSPALPLPSPPSSPPAVATNGQVVATALQEEDAEDGAAVFPAQEQEEEVPPGGSERQRET
ncbi:collagen alpha-6(VI) chain [Elysia marginata]|uniref:Collagen alpha-6(VI) chain n=1 Tax=Elysia marginata TaxID=1093978 RepID=A0AAV4JVR3_9GAST|nr:collagen alpha-6(VI) chain [Elysia marginata]